MSIPQKKVYLVGIQSAKTKLLCIRACHETQYFLFLDRSPFPSLPLTSTSSM